MDPGKFYHLLIVLSRVETKIDSYTGPWQAAYKQSRSCADLVWAQRMLISVVKNKQWELSKIGIDMSSAFDTIKRRTILSLLEEAGCDSDEIRLVRYLLSNTKLKVRVGNALSTEFESTLGAFQGDSLSGKWFTLVLAGALNNVRVAVKRSPVPISAEETPEEWEYADDVDFIDEDMEELKRFLPEIRDVLLEWNLFVNESKTEFTRFYLANVDDLDENGKKIRLNKLEAWRSTKSLGSLLDCTQDIRRRINLGNAAFSNYQKCWLKSSKIPLKTKLQLYNALVMSVMMYNCNSWAAPLHVLEGLDVAHRKHLRRILNVFWPFGSMSNEELYRRCEITEKLSEKVHRMRWTMFGHVLRSDERSPAFLSLKFALTNNHPTRMGRHQINLYSVLKNDLKLKNFNLNTVDDIYVLRTIASDRERWRDVNRRDLLAIQAVT